MKPPAQKTNSEGATVEVVEQVANQPRNQPVRNRHVDPDQIYTMAHRGCMGLPQEIVDYTMEMLRDDPRTLKACSLTCKLMLDS